MKITEAQLESDIIELLEAKGYPPVDRDEVYKEIFEQAENFKKNSQAGGLLSDRFCRKRRVGRQNGLV